MNDSGELGWTGRTADRSVEAPKVLKCAHPRSPSADRRIPSGAGAENYMGLLDSPSTMRCDLPALTILTVMGIERGLKLGIEMERRGDLLNLGEKKEKSSRWRREGEEE